MKCPVCDNEKWVNVDRFRLKKVDMCACDNCAFISYPNKYKSEKEMIEYYKKNYRQAPQYESLISGERKLHYHAYFLDELFKSWKESGLENPVVCDVGAAFGVFVNWVKHHFPNGDITGTELDVNYKKVAFYEFNIKLENEINPNKKYDMISSYHVLEHVMFPDEKLKHYASLLKPNGVIYLAAPIWYKELHHDIEYLYAEDHFNSWSDEHLEHIFYKCGLKILFKNDNVYGNTYILAKDESTKLDLNKKWNKEQFFKTAEIMLEAWSFANENNTAMALDKYKNFPSAWARHYELNRSDFDKNKEALEKFIKDAIENCPNSAEALILAADICARYERYDEAYDYFSKALKRRPGSVQILMAAANTFRMKAKKEKDAKKKTEYIDKCLGILNHARKTSMDQHNQVVSWMYNDFTSLDI